MSEAAAASQTDDLGTGNGATQADAVQKPTWIEQLPEDMRGDESLHGFKTIGDLVSAHKTTLAERDGSIKVPGEDASDEDREAFFKALGRPETPDDYELAPPEGLRDGLYNKDIEASFRAKVHELGISGKAAAEINNWYYQMMAAGDEKQTADQKAAVEAARNKLQDEWKGDEFKKNSELAFRAFTKYAGESDEDKATVQTFLEKTMVEGVPLGDHPIFLRVFAGVGRTISDDSNHPGGDRQGGEKSDEAKARARFPNTKFKE